MKIDSDYWKQKWNDGDILFNQSQPNAFLVRYFAKQVSAPTQVFVPLCGKSIDMKWLLDQGHRVIGVELSAEACEAFFTENRIAVSHLKRKGFEVFISERCTLYCGDIFLLTPKDLQGAEVAYDRAALVALPPDLRSKYFDHMVSLLGPRARILALTFEYPQEQVTPPPFSVPESEVRKLAGSLEVRLLENRVQKPSELGNPKFRVASSFAEKVYWITPTKAD